MGGTADGTRIWGTVVVSVGSWGGPGSSLLGVNVVVPRALRLACGVVNRLSNSSRGDPGRGLAGCRLVWGRGSFSVSSVKPPNSSSPNSESIPGFAGVPTCYSYSIRTSF